MPEGQASSSGSAVQEPVAGTAAQSQGEPVAPSATVSRIKGPKDAGTVVPMPASAGQVADDELVPVSLPTVSQGLITIYNLVTQGLQDSFCNHFMFISCGLRGSKNNLLMCTTTHGLFM